MKSTQIVWQTLSLDGAQQTVSEYLTAFEAAGVHVTGWAKKALSQPLLDFSIPNLKVDLVQIPESELVHNGGYVDQICLRGVESCLKYVRLASILELRLHYRTQPKGQKLLMAMDSINVDDEPTILTVENADKGLTLGAHPGQTYIARSLWVFEK